MKVQRRPCALATPRGSRRKTINSGKGMKTQDEKRQDIRHKRQEKMKTLRILWDVEETTLFSALRRSVRHYDETDEEFVLARFGRQQGV